MGSHRSAFLCPSVVPQTREPVSSPGAPPPPPRHFAVSHSLPTPSPVFLSQSPAIYVWVVGGGCYFGLPLPLTEQKKKLWRPPTPAPARNKTRSPWSPGASAPCSPATSDIDPRLGIDPCSRWVPSGLHTALIATLVLCWSSECKTADSFAGSKPGPRRGALCSSRFHRQTCSPC